MKAFYFAYLDKQPRYTLGKTERLKSRKLIDGLFSKGKSFSHFPFRVIWMFDEKKDSALQAAFSVRTKNFKKAVDRNRIKRLMREGWRLQKNSLEAQLATNKSPIEKQLLVFIIYNANVLPGYDEVYEKMGAIIKRLLKIVGEMSQNRINDK